jgi:hypothetical protein
MRAVLVNGPSLIEGVLREVLPKTLEGAGMDEQGSSSNPIHVVVLESCPGQGRPLDEGCSSLIGLTCQTPESALLDPRLVSFDARQAYLIQMPFALDDLVSAIDRFPEGAVRLFRHPGVNLLWHYKECITSDKPRAGLHEALHKRVQADHPLLVGDLDHPALFVKKLTVQIILSLYSGLAHDQHSSLEALITDLACSYSNQVPQEAFLSQVDDFFKKTDQIRRELVLQEGYFGAMIKVQSALRAGDAPLAGQFHPLHQSLNRGLQRLEAEGRDFLFNQGSSERVFEASYQAAQALGTLLEEWDKLRRRIQP